MGAIWDQIMAPERPTICGRCGRRVAVEEVRNYHGMCGRCWSAERRDWKRCSAEGGHRVSREADYPPHLRVTPIRERDWFRYLEVCGMVLVVSVLIAMATALNGSQ